MYAESLFLKLGAGCAVVAVSHSHHGKTEHQFGYSIGILSRSILHAYTTRRGCLKIHIVITGTGSHYNFEITGRIDHFGVNFVGTHYQSIHIGHSLKKLLLALIFFQKQEFIARFVHHFAYPLHGHSRKRFFGCNENFHIIA